MNEVAVAGVVIAVSGVVGAGKTTFIETFSKALTMPAYTENVTGNELLKSMYEDPKRWALVLQLNFLREKFIQMQDAKCNGNSLVERTIFEDIIFTRNHYEMGNVTEMEWEVYLNMYSHFTTQAPEPDLMIFLDVPDDFALERIRRRGIPHEQDQEDYYLSLNKVYRQWIKDYDKPKVIVDNSHFDYLNNKQHIYQMKDYIRTFIEEGKY